MSARSNVTSKIGLRAVAKSDATRTGHQSDTPRTDSVPEGDLVGAAAGVGPGCRRGTRARCRSGDRFVGPGVGSASALVGQAQRGGTGPAMPKGAGTTAC